jgi:type II secretory ATPase GspE/PulE/Tfp pilus assembly ATPase PilB-like protein
LVISTLHAGSCKGVFERLLALCAEPSSVAASVALVLNQRLVRRLCSECSGKGCAACLSTGFRGRLPLLEWVRVNETLRRRLAARDVEGLAAQPSLADGGRALVQAGLTTEAEVARILGPA